MSWNAHNTKGKGAPPVGMTVALSAPSPMKSILVVEDNVLVGRSVRMLLQSVGYEVVVFEDTPPALAYVIAHGPCVDLVLSDFDLPTETGYEFIRKAQVVQPTLKVLLMSAWAEENIMPRPRPWDWPQFISKPFKPNALRDAVLAVLEETEQQVRSTRRRESVAHFAESEA